MEIKLFDSERKVMETLWDMGDLTAGQLAKLLKEETGWNRNTTYTVIKKLIDKGAIERIEPKFLCKALITRACMQEWETKDFIDKMFEGSAEQFFSAFINKKNLSNQEIKRLKQIVDDLK